ncbi:MAG: 3'-5' exonuclease [Gammaproteobacteria bacterium]|nr:3'-5' exonuclease [Gammaproteobacteria bacterium]
MDTLLVFIVSTALSFVLIYRALSRASAPAPRGVKAHAVAPETADFPEADLSGNDWVVIDLETTGLSATSEITEIAIIAADGTILLDRTILPMGRIPGAASNINGLTRKKLKGSPRWHEVDARVRALLRGKRVVAYNGKFDLRLLNQTAERWGFPPFDIKIECLMLAYARYRGVPHPWRHGEYKWHKLEKACRYEGLARAQDHRALSDADLARRLAIHMSETKRPLQKAA